MTPLAGIPNQIEHIVALVLENRSFDHMLGDLGRSGLSPLDGGRTDMYNLDLNGDPVRINPVLGKVDPDLPHEFADVVSSLADNNGGFVRADQLQHRLSSVADPTRVMSYYEAGQLPVTHCLAQEYCVCDRWFASVPTGTWPNRLFLVAGTSCGRVTNTAPRFLYEMPTVFDRISNRWRVYCDQEPNVALVRHLMLEFLKDKVVGGPFQSVRQFAADCSHNTLPYFSFIEPIYLFGHANDGHPPRKIETSERLLGTVYSALRHSEAWTKSLLIVLYDEHGGLFDHAPRPSRVPSPDSAPGEYGFDFTSLGVRVPALLVSPWVAKRSNWRPPDDRYVDHTSLIATVLRRVGADPLTARDEAVADIWPALTESDARTDDENTIAQIDSWLESQSRQDIANADDPLAPEVLGELSGREIAQIVVSAAGPAPEAYTRLVDATYRVGGPWLDNALGDGPYDVPLNVALVDLMRTGLELAAMDSPPQVPPAQLPPTARPELAGGEAAGAV